MRPHPASLAQGMHQSQIELLQALALDQLPVPGTESERTALAHRLRRLEARGLVVRAGPLGVLVTEAGQALLLWLYFRDGL